MPRRTNLHPTPAPCIRPRRALLRQVLPAEADDRLQRSVLEPDVEAGSAVVRRVGNVRVDVELVPRDAGKTAEFRLPQPRTELSRPEPRTARLGVVSVVDPDEAAHEIKTKRPGASARPRPLPLSTTVVLQADAGADLPDDSPSPCAWPCFLTSSSQRLWCCLAQPSSTSPDTMPSRAPSLPRVPR